MDLREKHTYRHFLKPTRSHSRSQTPRPWRCVRTKETQRSALQTCISAVGVLTNRNKIILDHHGVTSAPFIVIPSGQLSIHAAPPPKLPLFVKPVTEGSSKGIDKYNKANSHAELEMAVEKVKARFPGQDILVESFLAGREFTVSILGTGSRGQVIGVREHLWQKSSESGRQATEEFASWRSKLSEGCSLRYSDVHDVQDPQVNAACRVAKDAWAALGCRDAGRVDIRFDSDDADGVPNVLEVSCRLPVPNPSPSPLATNRNPEPSR